MSEERNDLGTLCPGLGLGQHAFRIVANPATSVFPFAVPHVYVVFLTRAPISPRVFFTAVFFPTYVRYVFRWKLMSEPPLPTMKGFRARSFLHGKKLYRT